MTLEDSAQISDGGTLIPFEKSVQLSEEYAELLTALAAGQRDVASNERVLTL